MFTDLAAGNYNINSSGVKGSAVDAVADVVITEGEDHTGVDLVLRVGLAIEGRVVDPEGNPVPGCTVSAYSLDESNKPVRRTYDLTRGDGAFRLQGLDSETVTIDVEMSLFLGERDTRGLAKTVRTGVAAGTRDLVIVLQHASFIKGIVLSPDGTPAPNAELQAHFSDEPGSVYFPIVARADASGRFQIPADATHRYDLAAVNSKWGPEFGVSVEGINGDSTNVVLHLAPLH